MSIGMSAHAQTPTSDATSRASQISDPSSDASSQAVVKQAPPVDVTVVYTADVWAAARGGISRGERYLDNLDVTIAVDGERTLGLHGASFFAYALYNNGASLTGELVGDLQTVSNIDAGSRAIRLYEAWAQQSFARERGSIRLGLYDLNSEFDTNESSTLFINSSHGIGPDFSQTGQNGPSIFPVTSLAVRVDYRLSERILVRAAVLDGVPGDPARPRRTAIKLGSSDGVLVVGEAEYSDDLTKAVLGSWTYTAEFEDRLATRVAGASVMRRRNRGLYALVERRLSDDGASPTGLSGWLRAGLANGDVNPIAAYVGGGLVQTGAFAGRDDDRFGFAVAVVQLSSPYRSAQLLDGLPIDRREVNFELTYRSPITPSLTLQPDIQYVVNPGAVPTARDAIVVGLRLELAL